MVSGRRQEARRARRARASAARVGAAPPVARARFGL